MSRRDGKLLERTNWGAERRLHETTAGGVVIVEWAKRRDTGVFSPIFQVSLGPDGTAKLRERLVATHEAMINGVAAQAVRAAFPEALLRKTAATDALRRALPETTAASNDAISEKLTRVQATMVVTRAPETRRISFCARGYDVQLGGRHVAQVARVLNARQRGGQVWTVRFETSNYQVLRTITGPSTRKLALVVVRHGYDAREP